MPIKENKNEILTEVRHRNSPKSSLQSKLLPSQTQTHLSNTRQLQGTEHRSTAALQDFRSVLGPDTRNTACRPLTRQLSHNRGKIAGDGVAELSPSQGDTQNHTERVEPAGSQPEDAACSSQVTPTSWPPESVLRNHWASCNHKSPKDPSWTW